MMIKREIQILKRGNTNCEWKKYVYIFEICQYSGRKGEGGASASHRQ